MKIWFDGDIIDASDARISPLDHGITVGDGVFETLVVVRATPFAWSRHYQRLTESAQGLGIEVPSSGELLGAAKRLIEVCDADEGRLRVTLTAGPGPPGSGAPTGPAVAFMVVTPIEPATASVAVVVAPWTRSPNDPCTGLKTVSYAGNVRALAYARARGAGEALVCNTDGNLCEATGSNVFCVASGVVRTPPLSSGCLGGVTRALICELAAAHDIACEQVDVTVRDLLDADEAFLSSTTRQVQPISAVDEHQMRVVGGPVSTRLAAAFAELVATDLDP